MSDNKTNKNNHYYTLLGCFDLVFLVRLNTELNFLSIITNLVWSINLNPLTDFL